MHPFWLNIGQELQESHDDSFSPLADAAEVLAAEAMAEAVEKIKAGTAEVFIVFSLGILGDEKTNKYPLYRAYIGISHKGTLVGVHPTIP